MEDGCGQTIISDKQKGLVDRIGNVLLQAKHQPCACHACANFPQKNYKGLKYRELFWSVATSSTKIDFPEEYGSYERL